MIQIYFVSDEQKFIFDIIMNAVNLQCGGIFFLRMGKFFMWKTLSFALRLNGNIIFTVASSGIATLLLLGGRTADSKFAIAVLAFQNSTCNVV